MPIQKINGGYRYGTHGKVYYGASAKQKALTQMRAIKASEARAEKAIKIKIIKNKGGK